MNMKPALLVAALAAAAAVTVGCEQRGANDTVGKRMDQSSGKMAQNIFYGLDERRPRDKQESRNDSRSNELEQVDTKAARGTEQGAAHWFEVGNRLC